MANTSQARKRVRQADRRRAHNMSRRSGMRTAIKRVREAIAAGDVDNAREVFRQSTATIDRIANKRLIHKNKAARHKARLSVQLKAMNATVEA